MTRRHPTTEENNRTINRIGLIVMIVIIAFAFLMLPGVLIVGSLAYTKDLTQFLSANWQLYGLIVTISVMLFALVKIKATWRQACLRYVFLCVGVACFYAVIPREIFISHILLVDGIKSLPVYTLVKSSE